MNHHTSNSILLLFLTTLIAFAQQPLLKTGNMLQEKKWRFVVAEGGQGTVSESPDGTRSFAANCPKGFLSLATIYSVDIQPGHFYQAAMTLNRTVDCIPYLMVSMNGKRTPWPYVLPEGKANADETIAYCFTVEPDENKLSTHIIVKGTGKAVVKDVRVRELTPEEYKKLTTVPPVDATDFTGDALVKAWKPFNAISKIKSQHLSFHSAPNGGIACNNLNWNADAIKRINIRCAGTAHAYLKLEFTTEKNASSYVSLQALPGDKLRDYSFRVGQNPAWRGTIKAVKITWQSYESAFDLTFQRIMADGTDNVIPFVDEITDTVIPIDSFRPRATYSIEWLGGPSPQLTLQFQDQHHRPLSSFIYPAFATKATFTVPNTIAHATLTIQKNDRTTGHPCITELAWPQPDKLFPNWRGSWIWCKPETGPDKTTVWFRKTITLDKIPDEAAAVFTADDAFTLFVNGQKTAIASDNWRVCSSGDITKYLKAGANDIVAQVYNDGAWGGLLGEIYVKNGTQHAFHPTDDTWTFHIGGDTPPAAFENQALVLGAPPTSPWGQRMSYSYVGPKPTVTIKQAGEGFAVIAIDTPVAADLAKLPFTLHYPDGTTKESTGSVAPSTGKWLPGKDIRVNVTLPPNPRKNVSASLNCPFIKASGTFCTLPVHDAKPPQLATASIVDAGTRPAFIIDGKRYPAIYYDGLHKSENDWMLEKALQGGCSIVRFSLNLTTLWPAEDRFDFTALDNMMTAYAITAPDMKAIFQITLAMPPWWCQKYPDDCVAYDSGQPINKEQDRQALGSKRWLRDASFALRQIIAHIRQSWYADKIFAMGPAESWNCEWFWTAADGNRKFAVSGYSPADYETFRGYLKEKYKTDEALAQAWHEPGITFQTFKMPTPAEQDKAAAGNLMDPVKDAKVMDWFHFRNRAMGEAIETFGRTIKEETEGKWLVGVYYGYYVIFSHIYRKLQSVGHMEIERLARSPYVDMFWAPSLYTWRQLGMTDGIMQAAAAFTSHGKLPIIEQDMRTFSEPASYETVHGRSDSVTRTLEAMDRAFGLLLARGVGTHWYDMHELWFREKVLLDKMKEQIQLYTALPAPKGATPIQVCLVSDQESVFYTRHNDGSNLHHAAVFELIRDFAKVAVPYRHVFVNDLIDGTADIPAHKLYIITDAVMMDKARNDKLQERFQREHATVLYLYAYGVSRPDNGPTAENMQELLGIAFRRDNSVLTPQLHVHTPALHADASNGSASTPWFFPVSGFTTAVAHDSQQRPVLVTWQQNGVNSYFSTLMNPGVNVLQHIARQAGVHCYADNTTHAFHIGNDAIFIIPQTDGHTNIKTLNNAPLRCIAGPLEGQTIKSGQEFPISSCVPCGFVVE